jgi:hypothetical protein
LRAEGTQVLNVSHLGNRLHLRAVFARGYPDRPKAAPDDALWLWGRALQLEREGYLEKDIKEIISRMSPAMKRDMATSPPKSNNGSPITMDNRDRAVAKTYSPHDGGSKIDQTETPFQQAKRKAGKLLAEIERGKARRPKIIPRAARTIFLIGCEALAGRFLS